MAFYQLRGNRVFFFTYNKQLKKQEMVPRSVTRVLDGRPIEEIEAWKQQFEIQYEGKIFQPEMLLRSDDIILVQLDKFLTYLKDELSLDHKTITEHTTYLRGRVLQYFAFKGIHNQPTHWHTESVGMASWLRDRGDSARTISRCNISLRKFYKFLSEEGHTFAFQLNLRGIAKIGQTTPLKRLLQPAEVLSFAENNNNQLGLYALLGYFFSLRPQEVLALKREDFKAGSGISHLPVIKSMLRHHQFSKLAVHITKQRDPSGKIKSPKTKESIGWVACFNGQAAKMIVEKLKEFAIGDQLFMIHERNFLRKWSLEGITDITPKDLRRASIHYLGYETSFGAEPLALMKHARHKILQTTMLYCRRPDEEVIDNNELDLDA